MGTPPAPANGTIDVKPSDLFRVSGDFATEQSDLHKAANKLLDDLGEYQDAGGFGTSAQAFSTAYMEVGNRFLDVWAKSVVSVGGAAVGFTVTANNYAKADAASHPSGTQAPVTKPPPHVIQTPPAYRKVTDLKWGDDDGGDGIWARILEWVPDALMDAVRAAIKHAYRMGRVPDVYPFPHQHNLNTLSGNWGAANRSLAIFEGDLIRYMSGITTQSNSEWHDAMRQFCSSLWGSTAWGKSTAGYEWKHDSASSPSGATHPVFAVLSDTSRKISDLLREFAEAAVELNADVYDEYLRAVKKAVADVDFKDGVDVKDVKGLIKGIGKGLASVGMNVPLNIDTAGMNAIVKRYENTVDGLTSQFEALKKPLEEAYLSAPTFKAEEARAQSFGARALDDFKPNPKWNSTEDTQNGVYKIDLASHEWLNGGHSVDKHVGLSDPQLAQRLRDQGTHATDAWPHGKPSVSAASSFRNMEEAQKYTQYNIDKKSADIQAWLKGPPPPSDGETEKFVTKGPDASTGTSVTKQPAKDANGDEIPGSGYKQHGVNAKAIEATNISTVLRYDSRVDPPFVVLTSMPAL
ncbi:RNase A-like domain-containing protein [Streptomyces sp. NPDC051907]|uniref:RNase A-like domain-containing protein n=1 Tax=Streptomyces sp. NPDC051907 TaxID=3155284 RepID=UPI0034394E4B